MILFLLIACEKESKTGEAQKHEAMSKALESHIKSFEGRVGLYVKHLETGEEFAFNENDVFPTASLVKVPIMVKLFDKLDKNEIKLQDSYTYSDSLDLYPYPDDEGITGQLREGAHITLNKLANLMIYLSDNDASLWCQAIAGGGLEINAWLDANGFEQTRVNSRTAGREADREKMGWGQTTPREMAELLVKIYRGEAVSQAADEEMYRMLGRVIYHGEALAGIPPDVQAASKQGAISRSRSEVVLVNAPAGDYVFCIITDDQQDTSWEFDNDGFRFLREISNELWNYFEPHKPYQLRTQLEKYW
ncbi:MAG: serine hydrolase [Cyclobacteriaceae bacterium]|nr:serine hydrolase [Cyclobacteriaceae bacterium]